MNNTSNHTISIVERSSINISGVNKIESFDKEDFLLETVMGYMNIKGEDLEMVKLDTIEGKVVIKGKINSLMYLDTVKKKNKEESIFDGKPYSAVAFNFGPDEPNYYIIDEDLFIELKTYLESK